MLASRSRRRSNNNIPSPKGICHRILPHIIILALSILPTSITSLGYLKEPRPRNLVAYEDTVWWPRTENDPEPETTPQGLDRGGTDAQCGIVETLRNYDLPKNIFGDLMPVTIQEVYTQEEEITIEVSLITSNGGHFQFSLCPIEWGEVPTQECFDAHPLEFVKDNYYGATQDPNYPERIYIPDGDVDGRVDDETGFPGNKMAFSYQMALPCDLVGDLVLLQWYFVTALDCYHEGYLEYDFPSEWGDVFEERQDPCPMPLPPTGDGLPLQYWNCAEVQILGTGQTERCAPPTLKPTGGPTGSPSVAMISDITPVPNTMAPTMEVATEAPTMELTTSSKPTMATLATESPTISKRPTLRPTMEPSPGVPATLGPTKKPVVLTKWPTYAPTIFNIATCDELCLVPLEASECDELFDSSATTLPPPCLDEDGRTVNVGDVCLGTNGTCGTSSFLDNCNPDYDVYKRVPSCAKDDTDTTPEDTPISLPVLDNDIGDGLAITEWTEPEHGIVELVGDELVYTPDAGHNGPDEFEYIMTDSVGSEWDAAVVVVVTPVNNPPTANDDSASTFVNTNVNIPVLDNDTDPEDDPLSVSIIDQPENGDVEVRPNGSIVYVPELDYVGDDSFTYQICDSGNQCDTATVTITVKPEPNNPPVAVDDFVTISGGVDPGPTIPVLENDSDPEGDPLRVTEVTSPENGSVVITEDGAGVVYTPDEGYTGVDSFEYTACDPKNLCNTATVTVSVAPPTIDNEPPNAEPDMVTTPFETPIKIDAAANDEDPNGETPTITEVTQGLNGECSITDDNQILYTPEAGYSGPDICPYVVCDSSGECDTANVFIEVEEGPPNAEDDVAETTSGTPVTVDVMENDSHPNDLPLDVTGIAGGPENGACDVVDGQVQYTPNEGFMTGTDQCAYILCVKDTTNCDVATLTVEVSPQKPTAEDDMVETAPDTPVTVDVAENDSHPNDLPLEVTDIATQPENGVCEVVDGQVQYTPNAGFSSGVDECTYTICVEDMTSCDNALLTVEVSAQKPLAQDDLTETTTGTPVTVDVIENDSHPNDLPIKVTDITSQPENGVCEVVDGQVQYTPSEGFTSGSDQCTYELCVEDTTNCDDATLTVKVSPQKPMAEDDEAETPPNTPVTVDVAENDSHPNDLPLEVTDITNQANNGVCEIVDDQVQYTPNEDFIKGSDQCAYTICVKDNIDVCDVAILTVDIIEPPIAVDDEERTPVDNPVVAYVFENDVSPAGKPLKIVTVTMPENGSCDFSADGYIQYTPNTGFLGTDQCEYVVCIEGSTTLCDEATLVIDVVAVKIATHDKAETQMDTPIIVYVLDNEDYPEEGSLVVTKTSQPQNGTCEVVENEGVQYTPSEGFYGTNECKYTVCIDDNEGVCDEGTLTVEVIPSDPIATDDEATTPPDTPVLVDVTSNDDHPNELPLEVTEISIQPENGMCEIRDGQVQYTPNSGFVQVDSCEYIVCVEGTTVCDEGMLTVTIVTESPTEEPTEEPTLVPTPKPTAQATAEPSRKPVNANTRPFAMDDFASTPIDVPVVITVLDNDFDFNNSPLSVTSTTEPANGQAEINQDGTVTYTPNPGFYGDDSFMYTISDGKGGTDEATVVVSVMPPAQPKPNEPTDHPTTRPSALLTMQPSVQSQTSCDGICFEPLDPEECPACDPVVLPSCFNTTLEIGALCESDGECGLDDQLNNCEGTFDVYRRIPCPTDVVPTPTPSPNLPHTCIPREGESVTISSSGDAYIASNLNYNGFNNEAIVIDDMPKTDGLIKWKMTEDICECVTIKQVTLRLYVIDPSRGGGFVHVMNPLWEEDTVTWLNAPKSSGPPLEKIGRAANETWIDVDVTGLVSNSDKHVAVRIESCLKNQVQYASKEYGQGQFAPKLVIEFGPPPVGMHLLAARHDKRANDDGRRKLGGTHDTKKSSRSSKSSKPSKSSSKSSKSLSTSSKDSSSYDSVSNDGGPDNEPIPDIPVCPNLDMDLSNVASAYAEEDSIIVYEEQDESFGSSVLLELSPPQCGDIHTMINFDVGSLVDSPMAVEYASILINVIEGSDLIGATFLHTPVSDWSEDDVTWRNAPEYDKVIGSLSTIQNGMWYEIDVTSAVQNLSSEYLSVRVVPAAVTDASCEQLRLIFASKELDGFGPQLVIVPKAGTTTSYNELSQLQVMSDQLVAPLAHDGFVTSSNPGVVAPEVTEVVLDCSAKNDPTGGRLAIIPTDDAYISPRQKDGSHGDESMMIVGGRRGNVALIKFELSCLHSKLISSAVLKVYSIDGSSNGGMFHVLSHDDESAWHESDVTWSNAPTSYNHFDQLQRVRSGTWNELDITNALVGNAGNFVTIIITSTSNNRVEYGTKEGAHAPQLILTYEEHSMQERAYPDGCDYPAAVSNLVIFPADNAIIKEAEPDTNFAHMPSLSAKYGRGSRVDSLLKFTYGCVYPEKVISQAVLKLYSKNRTPRGGEVVSVLGTWNENAVTWSNAPFSSPSTVDFHGEIGRTRKGHWVEIDVTSVVTSMEGSDITFRIEGSRGNAAGYGSKEDGTHAPILEIFF